MDKQQLRPARLFFACGSGGSCLVVRLAWAGFCPAARKHDLLCFPPSKRTSIYLSAQYCLCLSFPLALFYFLFGSHDCTFETTIYELVAWPEQSFTNEHSFSTRLDDFGLQRIDCMA